MNKRGTVLYSIVVCTNMKVKQRKQSWWLSEELRKKNIDIHAKGKYCKTISKKFHVPWLHVPILLKSARFMPPRMWTQEEMQPQVEQTGSVIYKKNSQGNHLKSIELNSKLAVYHFLISPSITFWVIMGSGRKPMRSQLLTDKHRIVRQEFTKMNVGKPQSSSENMLWADETRRELFGQSY